MPPPPEDDAGACGAPELRRPWAELVRTSALAQRRSPANVARYVLAKSVDRQLAALGPGRARELIRLAGGGEGQPPAGVDAVFAGALSSRALSNRGDGYVTLARAALSAMRKFFRSGGGSVPRLPQGPPASGHGGAAAATVAGAVVAAAVSPPAAGPSAAAASSSAAAAAPTTRQGGPLTEVAKRRTTTAHSSSSSSSSGGAATVTASSATTGNKRGAIAAEEGDGRGCGRSQGRSLADEVRASPACKRPKLVLRRPSAAAVAPPNEQRADPDATSDVGSPSPRTSRQLQPAPVPAPATSADAASYLRAYDDRRLVWMPGQEGAVARATAAGYRPYVPASERPSPSPAQDASVANAKCLPPAPWPSRPLDTAGLAETSAGVCIAGPAERRVRACVFVAGQVRLCLREHAGAQGAEGLHRGRGG
jgi:hypothetical protein